jgi:hypothetical protein
MSVRVLLNQRRSELFFAVTWSMAFRKRPSDRKLIIEYSSLIVLVDEVLLSNISSYLSLQTPVSFFQENECHYLINKQHIHSLYFI